MAMHWFHTHPGLEKSCELTAEHIIIDKEAYERAQAIISHFEFTHEKGGKELEISDGDSNTTS